MKNEKGFSLLEVLISFFVMSVVLSGILPAFRSHVIRNANSEERMGAMNAAQVVLDGLRLQDPTSMPTSGSDDPVEITLDQKNYSVTASYCVNSSYCADSSSRHILVETAYKGETIYEVQTVYTLLR